MDVCFHCGIEIDPSVDEAHELEDGETCCDACHCDYLVFGDTFGDDFYKRELGWNGCPHKLWAEEEKIIREATA